MRARLEVTQKGLQHGVIRLRTASSETSYLGQQITVTTEQTKLYRDDVFVQNGPSRVLLEVGQLIGPCGPLKQELDSLSNVLNAHANSIQICELPDSKTGHVLTHAVLANIGMSVASGNMAVVEQFVFMGSQLQEYTL
jgi:hypothetical protein